MGLFWPENQAPAIEGSWDIDPEFWPIRIQIWFLKIGASPNHHRFQWFWGSPIQGMLHEWPMPAYMCGKMKPHAWMWDLPHAINRPQVITIFFFARFQRSPVVYGIGLPTFLGMVWSKSSSWRADLRYKNQGLGCGRRVWVWLLGLPKPRTGAKKSPWHHFCFDECLHLPKEFRKKTYGL